jgi:catechol 2,3-dioxygenase-like lactoylglutathione lyase family enzyme
MRKISGFILLLISSTVIYTQELVPYFGAVIVENIDSSVKWYSDVLQIKEIKRHENAEAGYKIVNLGNDKILLELLELKSSVSPKAVFENHPGKKWVKGFMKIGFKVHNIDSVFNSYKNRGIKMLGEMINDPVTGKKSFIILDPDGNYLQFFEF